MTRLATTVTFHEDESVVSFCSRLAAANGIRSAREFSLHMGFQFQKIVDGDRETIGELAYLAGQDASRLEARALVKQGGSYLLGTERIPKAQLTRNRSRFCPHCLAGDTAADGGVHVSRQYGRLVWLASFIRRCPRHDVFLSESATYVPAEDVNDFIRMLRHSSDIETPEMPAGGIGYEFESFASDRLLGRARVASWLDDIPLHVVARISEIIGAMSMHGRKVSLDDIDGVTGTIACERGYDVLAGGQESFVAYLKSMHQVIWAEGRYIGGFRIYGRLYSTLRALKDPDFDIIKQIIIDTTIDNLPVGPGDELFGPITRRRWHSVQSITKASGIRHGAVKTILLDKGAISAEAATMRDNSILVSAEMLDVVVKSYSAHISGLEAARQLNIRRTLWRTLVDLGFFGRRVLRRFPQASIDAFLARMASRRTTEYVEDADMMDIEAARQQCGCTYAEIVTLLDKGDLAKVMHAPHLPGLCAILVSAQEISEKTRLPEPTGMSLRKAEQALEVSTAVLANLVRGRYIASETALNPDKRCAQTVILPSSIKEFRDKYISSGQAADRLGLHFRSVRTALFSEGVVPSLTPDLVGASFYLVSEIERYELLTRDRQSDTKDFRR